MSTLAIVLSHALSLSIPATDGGRGGRVLYEQRLEHHLAVGAGLELRESAAGDYTGLRTGASGTLRWFWRRAAMTGWYVGGSVHADGDFTHDDVDHRWLGNALQLGLGGEVGYRMQPWRQLIVTPAVGLEVHRDIDLSGRLPGWTRGGFVAGLEVGWLF
jgi:hypothetical protein